MDAVAGKWPHGAIVQTSVVGSHASNGATERAILEIARQGRCMRSALESHFKDYHLQTTSVSFPWLIRHASWLVTRFLIKTDGKSAYQRLRGRDYHGEVAEFGEAVFCLNPLQKINSLDDKGDIGCWMGKGLGSDEHLIGTESGIPRCRSVCRQAESKRWNLQLFERVIGTPWQPRGEARLTDAPK